jgi:glycosyltransferase involved in cell wall biosynthesis
MKILFISYGHPQSSFLPGGGALRIHKFSEYLTSKGIEVFFLAGNFPGAEKVKSVYHNIFLGNSSSPYSSLLSFSILLPHFVAKNSKNFDVIVEDQSPFYMSFSPLFHKKSLIQFQAYVGKEALRRFPFPLNFAFMLNEKFYNRIYNCGVFVSEYLVKAFGWDKNHKKYAVIWNGVDEENFNFPSAEESNFILYTGRFSWYVKGIDILLSSIRKLKAFLKEKNIYFYFVGDGPDKPKIVEEVKKYNLPMKISEGWVSSQSLLRQIYSKCMFSVLPSRYEGFGLSVLELASFGKTSVVSDIPVFSWAKHFCLTFRKNSPEDLAEKIKELVMNRELRQNLGILARNFAKDKTWGKVSEHFYNFLLNL